MKFNSKESQDFYDRILSCTNSDDVSILKALVNGYPIEDREILMEACERKYNSLFNPADLKLE